jgi:hypothetical protein
LIFRSSQQVCHDDRGIFVILKAILTCQAEGL